MDAIPVVLYWLTALLVITRGQRYSFYVAIGWMPFGSFGVIPPALIGGLTLSPTPMTMLIIIIRYLLSERGRTSAFFLAINPNRLFLLACFLTLSVITTMIMPSLFLNSVTIIPLSLLTTSYGEPLHPTAQNVSQICYLTISVFSVFYFTSAIKSDKIFQYALKGLVIGGILTVVTGLADMMNQYVSLDFLLEPFRTASYALLTDNEVDGAKRVVGVMPEASAYGAVTIGFLSALYFFWDYMEKGFLKSFVVMPLVILLLAFTWLSTSSAAYLSLAVFFMVAFLDWTERSSTRKSRPKMALRQKLEFWGVVSILCLLAVLILAKPEAFDPLMQRLNEVVFNKTSSSSFEERSMWTRISWEAFVSTYGLGVGAGGTRASNGFVSIVSNLGLLAALSYYVFLYRTLVGFRTRNAGLSFHIIRSCLWAFLPPFFTNILVGTTPDFGILNAFLLGLAVSAKNISKKPPIRDSFSEQFEDNSSTQLTGNVATRL